MVEEFWSDALTQTIPKAEALLLLKQAAEIDRRGSIKGKKDAIDILTILARAGVDWKEYKRLAGKYGLENYPKELLDVMRSFDDKDTRYLGLEFVQFKKLKKNWMEEIKAVS